MTKAERTAEIQPVPGTRKVTVGALSSAIVTIVAMLFSGLGKPLPPEAAAAASTVVAALFTYLTRETYS